MTEKHWLDMTIKERELFRSKQRETLGFDDTELPSLYITIAKFIAPRLDRFADFTMSHPHDKTPEQWQNECKTAAKQLNGDRDEKKQAMQWITDNFLDLWS